MTEVLFYERPVPLNRSDHKDLRIKPIENLAYAAKVHSVPLTGVEFGQACRDMPIMFAGASMEEAAPIALLGLRRDENLFIDDKLFWERNVYVPAFVRRYPFVLAEKPPGSEGDDFTVFLDEAFAGFNQSEGERLFNEDGSDTGVLKNAVAFLSEFQGQVAATVAMMDRLRELELLKPQAIQISHNQGGQGLALNGLFVIDEDKLRALDAEAMKELVQNGWMGWIFAHLISMGNIERLIARLNERVGGTLGPAQPAPASTH